MSSQRIKGQEVQIIITRDGVLEETFTAIKNFQSTDEFEVKSVGYLGEKTNRKDEIFNGMKFSFDMHLSKKAFWTFKKAVKDRAQRVSPDLQINISGIFSFPNGETLAETLPDVHFGPMDKNVSDRGEYVDVKIEGECSDSTDQDF